MKPAHRGRCGVFARRVVLAGTMLAWCPRAFALNPALDVNQYAHTSWKIRDGFTKGGILSIAQTPDGYLWLGTESGLLRFDGVRAVPWQPPDNQLPSTEILSLLVARDGTLWIGTDKGLASWKAGTLTRYEELNGVRVGKLLEDRDGSIWMVRFVSTFTLCRFRAGHVQCYGEDGGPGADAWRLFEDGKANLWVETRRGVWRWQPGPPSFYTLQLEDNQGLAEDVDGALLISQAGGIARFVDGNAVLTSPLPPSMRTRSTSHLLRDRDGGLWIGTYGAGIAHLHHGTMDVFTQLDGLSGDSVDALFEDREGSIWAVTNEGIDRFRDAAVASYSVNQGLSNAQVSSVLAARDGSVWIGTGDGLDRWTSGRVTVYRERNARTALASSRRVSHEVDEITGRGMPVGIVSSIFQDSRGRVWVSTGQGVGYIDNDRFVRVNGVPGGVTRAIVEDNQRSVWIANLDSGLFRVPPAGDDIEHIPWARLNRKDPVMAMTADPSRGGLWFGFFLGGISYFADGQIRASYAAPAGLASGRISSLQFDSHGTLWVSAEGGLSRLKNGNLATLTSRNGLPCNAAQWVLEDDMHALWVCMSCGLVRIERNEIEAWTAAVDADDATRPIQVTIFDTADGVRTFVEGGYYSVPAAKSPDGKLWFMSRDGLSVVDPRQLRFNTLAPPVHIEQITADRNQYDAAAAINGRISLPPLTRDLQIDYTALSLVVPEKNRFRIKLEGWDRDWQDVGARRQAFYNNLPPRNYRFRVIASNNSGVWNEAGGVLDFSVAPAYYQTMWFRLSAVAAFLTLFAALYQLRLRSVARQFNARLEERVNERTRIARDLHDTLLQSFQGVLLKFHAITFLLPHRPEDARTALDAAIDQASTAITEGRDTVQALRGSVAVTRDLPRAITAFAESLSAESNGARRPAFSVNVEGTPRGLAPLLGDEVYRIAAEAVRNGFRHAQASRIEVELHYDRRQFRMRVRDDGKGIDPAVLDGGGHDGHFGLIGMQERAKVIGGTLEVWSDLGAGTEVELTVAASIAYSRSETGVKRGSFES